MKQNYLMPIKEKRDDDAKRPLYFNVLPLLPAMLCAFVCSSTAYAQTPTCTSSLVINTRYDPCSNSAIAPGTPAAV